eukprot:6874489-Prymnesium_polylepis.2
MLTLRAPKLEVGSSATSPVSSRSVAPPPTAHSPWHAYVPVPHVGETTKGCATSAGPSCCARESSATASAAAPRPMPAPDSRTRSSTKVIIVDDFLTGIESESSLLDSMYRACVSSRGRRCAPSGREQAPTSGSNTEAGAERPIFWIDADCLSSAPPSVRT